MNSRAESFGSLTQVSSTSATLLDDAIENHMLLSEASWSSFMNLSFYGSSETPETRPCVTESTNCDNISRQDVSGLKWLLINLISVITDIVFFGRVCLFSFQIVPKYEFNRLFPWLHLRSFETFTERDLCCDPFLNPADRDSEQKATKESSNAFQSELAMGVLRPGVYLHNYAHAAKATGYDDICDSDQWGFFADFDDDNDMQLFSKAYHLKEKIKEH